MVPVPAGHTALAYAFEGRATFGDQAVEAVHMLQFGDGDSVHVKTGTDPVRFMLISGMPFREPIAPYGPFVMNTREEIQQALAELREGTFIKAPQA